MSGICDTCKRIPCHSHMDGLKTCDLYESEETRWERLFGTPERAARMLERSCHLMYGLKVNGFVSCIGCPVYDEDADVDDCCYDALLEWLRGDA